MLSALFTSGLIIAGALGAHIIQMERNPSALHCDERKAEEQLVVMQQATNASGIRPDHEKCLLMRAKTTSLARRKMTEAEARKYFCMAHTSAGSREAAKYIGGGGAADGVREKQRKIGVMEAGENKKVTRMVPEDLLVDNSIYRAQWLLQKRKTEADNEVGMHLVTHQKQRVNCVYQQWVKVDKCSNLTIMIRVTDNGTVICAVDGKIQEFQPCIRHSQKASRKRCTQTDSLGSMLIVLNFVCVMALLVPTIYSGCIAACAFVDELYDIMCTATIEDAKEALKELERKERY